MCLLLEHQNPAKTSEKMGYFYRVTVLLTFYIPQTKRLRALNIGLQNIIWKGCFFNLALLASVALWAMCSAPASIWLVDFQNGEQQSQSGSDKKRRNRLQ